MTTRISKACHECRTRKIRCDGLQPCSHCTTRGSNCVYRAKARNRMRRVTPGGGSGARHSTTTRATSGSTDEDGDVDDGGGDGIGAGGGGAAAGAGVSGAGTGQGSQQGDGPDINIPSVAAIHGADPSRLVQVYYGPSSIFSLMNSIYHQIEGTVAANQSRQSLEEVGPGLDLFSHRRLFFGDFASGEGGSSGGTLDPMRRGVEGDAGSAMFLDRETASRFLERYLDTYWQLFPSISPAAYRQRLDDMFRPLSLFRFDTPDNVVLALALAIGADGLGEESVSCYLFSRARRGAEQLDEMVNAQMVQVYYLMAQLQLERARPNSAHLYLGSATRRAMAAGLHKEAVSRRQGSREESERKIVTVWALYFWETWTCFILGRPSSIRDPGGIASIPRDQELLRVMARLSRIVSTCVDRIYAPRHSSLLPVWTSANEIRAQLLQFAEKEPPKLGFRLTGSVHPGQLGFSQTMLSAFYHHTLQLTFRPFLILRAKMRKVSSPQRHAYRPPVWLDKACNYCLDAAKDLLSFLIGALRDNIMCREIKYFNFFVEGACYTFALDLIQETDGSHRSLPWIRSSIKCMQLLIKVRDPGASDAVQAPITIAALVRMVRSVIPEFAVDDSPPEFDDQILPLQRNSSEYSAGTAGGNAVSPAVAAAAAGAYAPITTPPTGRPLMPTTNNGMGPGNEASSTTPVTDNSSYAAAPGPPSQYPPTGLQHTDGDGSAYPPQQQPMMADPQMDDFAAMNMGLDFDFGITDMDAFLSIDPNQNWVFRP